MFQSSDITDLFIRASPFVLELFVALSEMHFGLVGATRPESWGKRNPARLAMMQRCGFRRETPGV
jgi:hypothetical protein